MSRADLIALIARVEAARGPDRELDAEITCAAYPELALKWCDKTEAFHTPQGQRVRVLPYTGSLDAAATLVPSGWFVMLGYQKDARSAGASLTEYPAWQNRGRDASGEAATPALALTAAALRARLAQMGDDA